MEGLGWGSRRGWGPRTLVFCVWGVGVAVRSSGGGDAASSRTRNCWAEGSGRGFLGFRLPGRQSSRRQAWEGRRWKEERPLRVWTRPSFLLRASSPRARGAGLWWLDPEVGYVAVGGWHSQVRRLGGDPGLPSGGGSVMEGRGGAVRSGSSHPRPLEAPRGHAKVLEGDRGCLWSPEQRDSRT